MKILTFGMDRACETRKNQQTRTIAFLYLNEKCNILSSSTASVLALFFYDECESTKIVYFFE